MAGHGVAAMTGIELGIALAVMTLGAALQGSVGFGQNLMAAPVVAAIEPDVVPGALLLTALAINALVAFRERATFDLREVSPAIVGRLPGVALGALAVTALSVDGLGLTLGCLVLAAALVNLSGVVIPVTTRTKLGAGLLSGFGATAVGIGGPPMAILYSGSDGQVLRSTLAGFFLVGTAISVAALVIVGELGSRQIELGLPLIPGVVVGYLASNRLTPILDRGYTRPAVLSVSVATAVVILVRSLV